MIDQICIFEDEFYANLYPLTLNRPAYLLKLGISDLLTKIIKIFPQKTNVVLHCRKQIEGVLIDRSLMPVNVLKTEPTLFINGRILTNAAFLETLKLFQKQKEGILVQDNVPLLIKVSKDRIAHFKMPDYFLPNTFKALKGIVSPKITVLNYFWDFVAVNGQEIISDAKKEKILGKHLTRTKLGTLVKPKNVFLGKNVLIKPGVVLDASEGPIVIENGVQLLPNAVVIGPAYIGEKTVIKAGAKIYHNTVIGPLCKIGGEVEGCIFQGYSNKQHEGFLGHSFVGEWVNLGAGTENSDLKNNYSSIKVLLGRKEIDTKSMFVGCCVGDHTKTGIKTMINSGSIFGMFCNIFGAGYQPKYLPNFIWRNNNGKTTVHLLEEAIATARQVVKRRNSNITISQEDLFRKIFAESQRELKTFKTK
jgi:UDP-N-acetylglucosamine diphosphorylase/glucosamine-1-phosphate N-acetyltransferase